MALTRLLLSDNSWTFFEKRWQDECEGFGESFDDFAAERIRHARSVACEQPIDARYGIFALDETQEFAALMHINRAALPGTQGLTLRVLWIQLSPKFDFEDVSETAITDLAGELIFGAIEIAEALWPAQHVKLHIGNFADKRFFLGIAKGLEHLDELHHVAVRGNWLHLSLKSDSLSP